MKKNTLEQKFFVSMDPCNGYVLCAIWTDALEEKDGRELYELFNGEYDEEICAEVEFTDHGYENSECFGKAMTAQELADLCKEVFGEPDDEELGYRLWNGWKTKKEMYVEYPMCDSDEIREVWASAVDEYLAK